MSLSRTEIEKLAHLARLSLRDDEVPRYVESLSSILEFVGQLESAQTSDIEPMAHPLPGLAQRLRNDEATEKDRHGLYQQNAPRVEGGLYLVPKVIE